VHFINKFLSHHKETNSDVEINGISEVLDTTSVTLTCKVSKLISDMVITWRSRSKSGTELPDLVSNTHYTVSHSAYDSAAGTKSSTLVITSEALKNMAPHANFSCNVGKSSKDEIKISILTSSE
jgi:hypothetical protein